jgi:hypothetical protein
MDGSLVQTFFGSEATQYSFGLLLSGYTIWRSTALFAAPTHSAAPAPEWPAHLLRGWLWFCGSLGWLVFLGLLISSVPLPAAPWGMAVLPLFAILANGLFMHSFSSRARRPQSIRNSRPVALHNGAQKSI